MAAHLQRAQEKSPPLTEVAFGATGLPTIAAGDMVFEPGIICFSDTLYLKSFVKAV